MKTNAKVYVMVDGEGRIKLGHSVNPTARSKQMPRPVTLVHETDVIEQAERVERLAHRILALHGTHLRGEWFEASLEDALQAIEIAIRQAEQEELALGGRLDGKADIEISVYAERIQANFRITVGERDMVRDLQRQIVMPDGSVPTETDIWKMALKEFHARKVKGGRKS